MSKHTPGPWMQDNVAQLHIVQRGGDGHFIADCSIQSIENEEIEMANARLIAAAPELLEACEHAIERLKKLDEYRKTDSSASIGLIERAIAKATGGE